MCSEKDGGFLWQILNMFSDNPREFTRKSRKTYSESELHTFVVEKPFCCPPDEIVTAALHPIGVPVFNLTSWVEQQSLKHFAERMKIEMRTFENLQYGPFAPGFLPMAFRAKFQVPKSRANQAEYWLWRTRRVIVVGGEVNPRNRVSAVRHNGKMPRASDPSKGQAYARALQAYASTSPTQPTLQAPMLESSCKQAQELWNQVNRMAQGAKPKRTKAAKGRGGHGWFIW